MKKYNIIYADPPWDVKAGPEWNSNGKSRDLVYPTMSIEDIKNMQVKEIADKNCHLYLWTINKYLREIMDYKQVFERNIWNFRKMGF